MNILGSSFHPCLRPISITRMLHNYFKTKDNLAAYSAHPFHVSVVNDLVLPIVDDITVLANRSDYRWGKLLGGESQGVCFQTKNKILAGIACGFPWSERNGGHGFQPGIGELAEREG